MNWQWIESEIKWIESEHTPWIDSEQTALHCLFTVSSLSVHCPFTVFTVVYSLSIHCSFTVDSLSTHCLFSSEEAVKRHWRDIEETVKRQWGGSEVTVKTQNRQGEPMYGWTVLDSEFTAYSPSVVDSVYWLLRALYIHCLFHCLIHFLLTVLRSLPLYSGSWLQHALTFDPK
jgi:hypothetical protein